MATGYARSSRLPNVGAVGIRPDMRKNSAIPGTDQSTILQYNHPVIMGTSTKGSQIGRDRFANFYVPQNPIRDTYPVIPIPNPLAQAREIMTTSGGNGGPYRNQFTPKSNNMMKLKLPVQKSNYQDLTDVEKADLKNRLKTISKNDMINSEARQEIARLAVIRTLPFYGENILVSVRDPMQTRSLAMLSNNEDKMIQNYMPWYVNQGGSVLGYQNKQMFK
jgi:hypothetical protein